MGFIVGLFGLAISSAIIAVVTGLVLMLLARPLAQREPSYGEAWGAMFTAHFVGGLAQIPLELMLATADIVVYAVVSNVVGLIVLTVILSYKIEATVPRALLTAAVMMALGFAFSFALLYGVDSMMGDVTEP